MLAEPRISPSELSVVRRQSSRAAAGTYAPCERARSIRGANAITRVVATVKNGSPKQSLATLKLASTLREVTCYPVLNTGTALGLAHMARSELVSLRSELSSRGELAFPDAQMLMAPSGGDAAMINPSLGAPPKGTLDLLARRRSTVAKLMGGPGPDPQQLNTLLRLAARTPDHGKLFPWRFMVFEGDARERFGEILEALLAAEQLA